MHSHAVVADVQCHRAHWQCRPGASVIGACTIRGCMAIGHRTSSPFEAVHGVNSLARIHSHTPWLAESGMAVVSQQLNMQQKGMILWFAADHQVRRVHSFQAVSVIIAPAAHC